MVTFEFGQFAIEVLNVPDYSPGSADNPRCYGREHRLDDGAHTPSSRHAARVLSDVGDSEVASCILFASGGATGIHDHSALVNGDSLIFAVGPFMVSLELPTLDLNWKIRTDTATCFGVHHSKKHQCYISHGELNVARVSYAGAIEWSQGGADIFANGFFVMDDEVEAIDFNDEVYVWEIGTGRLLRSTSTRQAGMDPS